MAVLKKNHLRDILFLQPVRLKGEKLHRSQVRLLCCDVSGHVFTAVIGLPAYEKARDDAMAMQQRRTPFATIGLETGPGKYRPVAVEISPVDAWALERILEHARKSGRLPDILKKYIRPIIALGEAARERPAAPTPRVLERLPYYPPGEIEISVPIYKAAYSYPLIVLKRLRPDEHTSPTDLKLLILDSDGDLAAIRAPAKLVRRVEREITANNLSGRRDACLLISRRPDGLSVTSMPVSQPQKKALSTLAKYFAEKGSGKQPMPVAVRTVLTRARDRMSPAAP
jgi:hypothetical protein